MFPLKDRIKNREYLAKVNAGEIKDSKVSNGTAENGDVIGDDGKPVPGTAAKGRNPEETPHDEGLTDATDYTKFKSHAELNAEMTKLGLTVPPDGWTDDKPSVAEKQKILADLTKPAAAAQTWA